MRRFLWSLIFFAFAFGCGVSHAETGPSMQELKAWVGKYPNDEINAMTFWQHPAFAEPAKKMLKDRYKMFVSDLAEGVNTPLIQSGDLLYASTCRPHDCTGLYVKVFVDLKKNTVHMCWSDLKEDEEYWFSSDRGRKGIGLEKCLLKDGQELFDANVKE